MQGTPDERLSTLKEIYAIDSKRHLDFPNLVGLRYNQIESPLGDSLVQQARGLILDTEDNWAIVARPFDKFFNYGEKEAASIDWASAIAQEKLDGTLCIVYYYANAWRVGTTGTPDASGEVGSNSKFTFQALFWWLWNVGGRKYPLNEWRHLTFMFEMMTPWNRIVCRYPEQEIVFLGARSTLDGQEWAPDDLAYRPLHWKAVQQAYFSSIEGVQDTFQKMDPLKQEGYVVVDANFNRIKVKHPGYVALHHMRGNGYGPRRVLEVILRGEAKETIAAFPEWSEDFGAISHALANLIGETEADFQTLSKQHPLNPDDIKGSQKAFALPARDVRCSSALFAVRAGKSANIRSHICNMPIDSLLILLDASELVSGPQCSLGRI